MIFKGADDFKPKSIAVKADDFTQAIRRARNS